MAANNVVGRIGRVLRALSQHEPEGTSTTQVARDTGLARPTVHRLLVTLTEEGLADRVAATGRWHLGPEVYLLGAAAAHRYDVTEAARTAVGRLSAATGESAFFSALRGEETVCLLRHDGSFPIRSFVLFEGARFPLGVVSAGIVILAHLPEHESEAYLSRVDLASRWGESHSTPRLRERLAEVRLRGYSVNPGLIVEGSWGMAAAVFDESGYPRGALSLTGIESRFGSERRPELGRLLLEEAHRLGRA